MSTLEPWTIEFKGDGAWINGTVFIASDWDTWREEALLMYAAPDLAELAKLVAQDYEDAADWKDARGKLASMARAALDKAGIVEDASEDEDAIELPSILEVSDVYSRDECPFNYCDSPEECKHLNRCRHAN